MEGGLVRRSMAKQAFSSQGFGLSPFFFTVKQAAPNRGRPASNRLMIRL